MVEAFWAAGFALANSGTARRPVSCISTGGERVMVVAPHPDDECTGCGGTLALHARAGDPVTVVQVTDGLGLRTGNGAQAVSAQVRQQEARAASKALGIPCLEQWALPERYWREDALRSRLRTLIANLSPTLIYAPSCIDYHPDHMRVARALAAALKQSGTALRVRVFEISVPLGRTLINRVADTSDVVEAHDAALAAYLSQMHVLRSVARLRRYRARVFRMRRGAEGFWELSPLAYQALLTAGDWLGPDAWSSDASPFRSVRDRPLTDPLAFWRGRTARLRLKAHVTRAENRDALAAD
jgi:LmbE family N-acetylglucosaminyl deacetylase